MSMLVVLVGAGGHGRVALDAARTMRDVEVAGFLDARATGAVDGVPVLGGDEMLTSLRARGITHAVITVGSVGPGPLRARLFELVNAAGLAPFTIVHRDAVVAPSAEVGAGTVIFAGAIVNPGARIGRNCIVNTGAIVEHDCAVGDHVHLSPRAVLGGGVAVGDGAHVGIGATVLQGIVIGEAALVGAGAVVVREVGARVTVAGVPARPLST